MSRKRGLSVLVTVLFTDIVGSTEIAAELGGPVGLVRASPEGRRASEDLLEGVFEAVGHPWTLTFEGGRYEESQFGPNYGDAEVFFAKPSTLLLYHRLAPQTFGGHCPNYEEYRWRLRGERLDLVLVSGGCREYSSDDNANAEWTRVG